MKAKADILPLESEGPKSLTDNGPVEDGLTPRIFEAIGFRADDDASYDLLIERAELNGEVSSIFRDDLIVHGRCWRLGAGLEVWAVLYDAPSEKYYADCRPAFRGRYVHVLTPWELIEYCEDGEAIVRGRTRDGTEVVVELQNFTEVSSRFLREQLLKVSLAGLAWNVRADESLSASGSAGLNFSPSIVSIEQAAENEYQIRARLLAWRELLNPVSGARLCWMFVDTGAIRLEIVASSGAIQGRLRVGITIDADVWLQGHLLAEYEVAERYEGVDTEYQKGDFWGLLRRSN